MKPNINKCNSYLVDNVTKDFLSLEWDLSDEILSEGTKAQTPNGSSNLNSSIWNNPFSTARNYHAREKDRYFMGIEGSKLPEYRFTSIFNNENTQNSMYKYALINSANNIQKQNIEESYANEEHENAPTLK